MLSPGRRGILLFVVLMIASSALRVRAQMDWKLLSSNYPRSRSNHALAHDPVRNRTVLFGGLIGWTAVNDTWEWDGKTWIRRQPKTSPPARFAHAMVYDAVRQRILLFGGTTWVYPNTANFSDTWEWDGKNWNRLTAGISPPARYDHAMSYDAARQRVVLFGGCGGGSLFYNDTWEWDGKTWARQTPATSPPARNTHAMAYDAAMQRVVLFGGSTGFWPNTNNFNDTWVWDGRTWTRQAPSTSPPNRYDHSMSYDAARRKIVLLGGCGGGYNYFNDTWEWDGMSWTLKSPATSPPKGQAHAMTYDAARKRILLMEGNRPWEWDGNNWNNVTPTTGFPPARFEHATAYDAARDRVVLFGGWFGASPFSDTWEWNGQTWTRQVSATSPPARYFHAMAYDAARQQVVLFGGCGGGNVFLNDTWVWDGKTWTRQAPTTSPPARHAHAMAYDTFRQRVMLFGGSTGTWPNTNAFNDTWEWDGKNWARFNPSASPPASHAPAMAFDAVAQKVVLFGGWSGGTTSQDTWEWDGKKKNWTRRRPTTSPAVRWLHTMGYDAARQRVVLFGGYEHFPGPHSIPTWYNDTWEWDGNTWIQRTPPASPPVSWATGTYQFQPMVYDSARGFTVLSFLSDHETWAYVPRDLTASTHLVSIATGGNVILSVDAGPPHAGKSCWITGCMDSGSPRGIRLGSLTLLLNPDPYFWLTALHPNLFIAGSLSRLDGSGRTAATVKVPKNLPTGFIGARFYHAYVVFRSSMDYTSSPVPLTFTR